MSDLIILGFPYISLIWEDFLDNFQDFFLFWISSESHWLLSSIKKTLLHTKSNGWNIAGVQPPQDPGEPEGKMALAIDLERDKERIL